MIDASGLTVIVDATDFPVYHFNIEILSYLSTLSSLLSPTMSKPPVSSTTRNMSAQFSMTNTELCQTGRFPL